jgi:hypothetical protein
MQIHELTQKQPVNEILGAIKNVVTAVGQPGGLKSLGSHLIPGAYSNIAAAQQGDFAKRMQSVQNTGLMKQAAANIQSQWEQYRKQVSPMTQTTPQQQAQQQKLKSQLLAKKVSGAPKPAKLPLPESQNLTEAAGVIQLTDWYKQKVIPPSYAAYASEYLKNPTIQVALKKIATAETQPDAARQQAQTTGFQELMAATAAVSQQITAKNPQVAGAAPAATRTAPVATGPATAKANISKAAGITTAQIDAIAKVVGGLPSVTRRDPNTINYLQALGFDVR